jgi:transketolase
MELKEKADSIRREVVRVAIKNKAGHIAPSLSSIDILTALYYGIMKRSVNPAWENRDRLVFSKAHGCYGLYAILADIGLIDKNDWENFYNGSALSGCLERDISKGLEASCGSLGHGLPMAVGLAFGARLLKTHWRTYCVVGDGEMQEGSMWEALQFAVKHSLDNLTVIVDNNGLQAMDFLENVLTPTAAKDDLQKKCTAFGCRTYSCNGHDTEELRRIIASCASDCQGKPQVIIAETVKGYGILCMENIPKFHFRLPSESELARGTRYERK